MEPQKVLHIGMVIGTPYASLIFYLNDKGKSFFSEIVEIKIGKYVSDASSLSLFYDWFPKLTTLMIFDQIIALSFKGIKLEVLFMNNVKLTNSKAFEGSQIKYLQWGIPRNRYPFHIYGSQTDNKKTNISRTLHNIAINYSKSNGMDIHDQHLYIGIDKIISSIPRTTNVTFDFQGEYNNDLSTSVAIKKIYDWAKTKSTYIDGILCMTESRYNTVVFYGIGDLENGGHGLWQTDCNITKNGYIDQRGKGRGCEHWGKMKQFIQIIDKPINFNINKYSEIKNVPCLVKKNEISN